MPKLGVVAEEGAELLIGVFLEVHSTSAANRTWSAFMPFCRRRFSGDTEIISLTRYFPYKVQ